MSLLDTLVTFFTCGAGSLVPQNGLLSLLTLDARSSYPWPLCWGNALWGYVAYRMYRDGLPKKDRPGFVYGVGATFLFWTMPANIFTNLLILGRTPGAFTSWLVLPAHFVACAFVEWCPGALALLSGTYALAFIDSFGVLDNVTTGLNFLEEAHGLTHSAFAAVLAAMTTNVGGGIARHFISKGFTAGAATFDDAFKVNVLYSIATNGLYYYLAVAACQPQETAGKKGKVALETPDCSAADLLYVVLPLVAVVKNLLPLITPAKGLKHKRA
jgi:hypothetical protein